MDVELPEHPSAVRLAYIKGYVAAAEPALSNTANEQWRDDFDVPALNDRYLVNELMRN